MSKYQIHTLRRFNDLGSFVEYARKGGDPRGSSNSPSSRGDTFYGDTADLGEACDLALNGWMAVRDEVDNLSTSLIAQLRDSMKVGIGFRSSVIGPVLDIGGYSAGSPQCMVQPFLLDMPGPQRVVRILISTTCSSFIRTETIIQRGIAVTALVELLGKANKAVEIYVEDTVNDNYDLHVMLVQIKEANEPLDINRLMFAMGHPAWQRRVTFAAEEAESASIRRKFGYTKGGGYAGSGYGAWVQTGATIMQEELGEDTIVCKALRDNTGWDATSSVKWIIQTLRNCGVDVETEED